MGNPTQKKNIHRRRLIVSSLFAEGVKKQNDIVKRLKEDHDIEVTQATISGDLKALDRLWVSSSISNTDKWKRELIRQYRLIYQQAYQAWQLSMEDATEETVGPDGEVTSKRKGQSGNPALLKQAQDAMRAIREIVGLDAAKELNVAGKDGGPIQFSNVVVKIPDEALDD